MADFWTGLLSTDFMPHGHCYRWQPDILWLNVVSDGLIALAYYSIPMSLFSYVRRRSDLIFSWVFVMFGVFILACRTTHVMAIWTVWFPNYGVEGLVKLLTAAVSVVTAVLLVPLVPRALAVPSPVELERANEALAAEIQQRKQAEERYRNLLESAPDAMVVTARDGTIVLANAQTETLFGYPRQDLVGRPVELLVPDRARTAHVAHREAYQREPRLRPMGDGLALHGRRRDGSEFPIEISLSPLDAEGGPLVTAVVRDVTARQIAEETVREYAVRLETLSRQLMTAQEAERRTIACELHDQIGQSLTALKIGLKATRAASDAPAATALLDDGLGLVEQVLQQVREMSLDLRPSLLDDLGLAAALRWYLDRQARRAGWEARVDADRFDPRLPPDVEIACFRIVQEAVTNVLRHAEARHVMIVVRQVGSELQLVVRDDGKGMDVARARTRALRGGSMGLLGMEERASLLGGRFEIESIIARGTEVRAYFPLRDRDDVSGPTEEP